MVRKLDTTDFKDVLKMYKASKDMIPILKRGIKLCTWYKKPPVIPNKGEVSNFWAQWELPMDKKLYQECVKKHPELLTYYEFTQLKWASDYYGFMEELELGPKTISVLDLIVYFSVLYPFPNTLYIPFPYFVEYTLPISREAFRKTVAIHMIEEDPEALKKLAEGSTIPWYYTKHMSYQMLKRLVGEEVIKRNPEQFKALLKAGGVG